jgi:orotate phosphoribosyltransferase
LDRRKAAERLLERAKELGALKFGDFTLSSGQKSKYYFDGRLLSLDPEGADLISAVFLDIARQAGAEAVGGPAVAAVPIVGAMVVRSRLEGAQPRQGRGLARKRTGAAPPAAGAPAHGLTGFFVRAEAKKHGTGKQIEGPLRRGMNAVVLDDTVSTGGSLLSALDAVQDFGCQVVMTLCVLDRRQGGSGEVRRRGLPFIALWEADAEGNVSVAAS